MGIAARYRAIVEEAAAILPSHCNGSRAAHIEKRSWLCVPRARNVPRAPAVLSAVVGQAAEVLAFLRARCAEADEGWKALDRRRLEPAGLRSEARHGLICQKDARPPPSGGDVDGVGYPRDLDRPWRDRWRRGAELAAAVPSPTEHATIAKRGAGVIERGGDAGRGELALAVARDETGIALRLRGGRGIGGRRRAN